MNRGSPYQMRWGYATVKNCVFYQNYAEDGGGLHNADGKTTIKNSTFSANSAAGAGGGGLFAYRTNNAYGGYCDLDSCTIVCNRQLGTGTIRRGGGVAGTGNGAAPMTITNSIVCENISDAKPTSNNVDSADLISFSGSNLVDVTSNIGPLQNNGGTTWTHALVQGSAAIDAGSTSLVDDQRGTSRPQGSQDDIGAYEGSVTGQTIGCNLTAPTSSPQ